MPERVSVIILNYNGVRTGHLRRCLHSLARQTYPALEVIVVDNASTDDSAACLRQECPWATLITAPVNLGFCRGNNVGYRAATGDYILFANNDTAFEPDSIGRMVEGMQRLPSIGMLTGKLLRPLSAPAQLRRIDSAGLMLQRDFTLRDRGFEEYDEQQFDQACYVFGPCGAAAFFRAAALREVIEGDCLWDEDFEAYYEDGDLAWRLHLRGWLCLYYPEAVVTHYRGGTAAYRFSAKTNYYKAHTINNRYLMLVKNATLSQLIRYGPFILGREALIWGYLALHPRLMAKVVRAMSATFKSSLRKRRERQIRHSLNGHALFEPRPIPNGD
jgi:GT2 family glycosyltransferase